MHDVALVLVGLSAVITSGAIVFMIAGFATMERQTKAAHPEVKPEGPTIINAYDMVDQADVALAALTGLLSNPANAENPQAAAAMAFMCVDPFYEGLGRVHKMRQAMQTAQEAMAKAKDMADHAGLRDANVASAETEAAHTPWWAVPGSGRPSDPVN